jgi:hypothetical protein
MILTELNKILLKAHNKYNPLSHWERGNTAIYRNNEKVGVREAKAKKDEIRTNHRNSKEIGIM